MWTRRETVQPDVYPENRAKISSAIRSVKARGGTDLTGALVEARTYLEGAPGQKIIVLFTDGARSTTSSQRHSNLYPQTRSGSSSRVCLAVSATRWHGSRVGRLYMLDPYRALDHLAHFVAALHGL